MKCFKKYSWFLLFSFFLIACSQVESENDEEQPEEKEEKQIEPIEEAAMNTESSNVIIQDNVAIFPEPNSLTEVKIDTLGKEVPEAKDEGELPVMLTLTVGGSTLNTYGEIKVQGSSTARWPKKNWRFKFYADEERTEKVRIQIGDSVPSHKWIAKAEWVDPTLLRNGVSFKLWEEMVQSRTEYPQYEVDNAWIGEDSMPEGTQTGAQGFPETHPIHVKVNDEHYGISLLLMGHDRRNFNIDKENPNHIYMEFDARGGEDSTKTWEKFSADGIGTWVDGYHPKNDDFTAEQKEAVDTLSDVINGTQKNFEEEFDTHFDKTNMIDMLLFLEAIYDYDAVAQDAEMITYDLEKWYLLPWDKDTTFGMDWEADGLKEDSATDLLIDYEEEDPTQKPWFKTYHAFTPEVEARYAQLRDEGVFSSFGLYQLTGDITKKIPAEIWEAERERWDEEGRPALDETSTSQVISWFDERLEVLDEQFNYVP